MKDNLLKNWEIEKYYGNYVLIGDIYNDTKKRFSDGSTIQTSRLFKIDFQSGIAKTKNSIYKLDLGDNYGTKK